MSLYNRSSLKLFLFTCLCFTGIALGQEVNITGTVTSTEGDPISDATLTLVERDLTTTSDEQGYYEFIEEPTNTHPMVHARDLSINLLAGRLIFKLDSDQPVNITLYNTAGKKLQQVVNEFLPAGPHELHLGQGYRVYGLNLLKITAGNYTGIFKLSGNNLQLQPGISGPLQKRTALAMDSITAEADGFISKTVMIEEYISEMDIELTENVPPETEPLSNFQVMLDGKWTGICCDGSTLHTVPDDQECTWIEEGRVIKDQTEGLEFDCPEGGPLTCACRGSGERMHGAPDGPVNSSLIREDGAPIFPNIGRETCSYVDDGIIKTRWSSVTGNKWDPDTETWPDPDCPHFRLKDFYLE